MKKTIILCMISIVLTSCIYGGVDDDGGDPVDNSSYDAITMPRDVFEASLAIEAVRPVETSGKIYVQNNFLFVNDVDKGFHVYENSNPENPQNIGFINVLGSTDLAIRNNTIYVHHARDLVAMQYNAGTNALVVSKRIPDVFPESFSPDGFSAAYFNVPDGEVIVGYELKN